jgi:hypothetical protein
LKRARRIMKRLASVAVVIWMATLGANTGGLALSYARSSSRRRPTPCGANTVSLSLPRPRPDTDHAPGMGHRDRPDAPRFSQARSRREPPRRRGSGHRHVHGPTSRIRGRLRAWLAHPWPSPLSSLARCPQWGSSLVGFTQIADATDPVRGLTPCQRPPAGRRSRRLVVCSRLACLEALVRKDGHDLIRRPGSAMFLFDPRDPAVLAKSVEARHRSHHGPLCVKIFELPWPTAGTPGGMGGSRNPERESRRAISPLPEIRHSA